MSAAKIVTHIAALQLVERGVVGLDEPVSKHLPEVKNLPLIDPGRGAQESFVLSTATRQMTLRHLLLYTSGLDNNENPLVRAFFDSSEPSRYGLQGEFANPLVERISLPLICEPGEGFAYGWSIYGTQLLVERAGGKAKYVEYAQEHVFDVLGMQSATYLPKTRPDVWSKRLQMVETDGMGLVEADEMSQGFTCAMSDMAKLLGDLISGSSKLLGQESIDLLFKAQFSPSSAALASLRGDKDNYTFVLGKTHDKQDSPPVNWSAAGLVMEEDIPHSGLPAGTVTWEGMPNVLWAMNREKGMAALFATQLLPVWEANELACLFMRNAWKRFAA
ncbi:hypothetical protein HIM_07959 [Hirsutella minnesotensis 3608]|uniref:Beta-lactamase-related domain-containing protein n=1 Tax=Hirsutella minnesotensis 3608 TaxID=1043627 RepID=A0A0F7ZMU3_9HYPO|nr:hypothetical protein HIM_07959 [Hirsutella minnesotensis 3608]